MDILKLKEAFESKGYIFRYFDTSNECCEWLDGQINGKTVGFGDSQTLFDMGLYEKLSTHNMVYSPMHPKDGEDFYSAAKKCMDTQVYLVSVNGAAETGEMVNIDGYGNRVSSSLYCHDKIYFVFGINKIMPTLQEAIDRARNIAAPKNAKRLHKNTPCAVNGDKCYNCSSPDRICNAMMVHLHKQSRMDVEVIVIGESAGL
jgi:hypothetical protein